MRDVPDPWPITQHSAKLKLTLEPMLRLAEREISFHMYILGLQRTAHHIGD